MHNMIAQNLSFFCKRLTTTAATTEHCQAKIDIILLQFYQSIEEPLGLFIPFPAIGVVWCNRN